MLLVVITGTSFGQPDKKSLQEVIDAEADRKWKVATDLGIGTREVLSITELVTVSRISGSTCDTVKATDELTSVEAKYTMLLTLRVFLFLKNTWPESLGSSVTE
jgi:hypothetical protein